MMQYYSWLKVVSILRYRAYGIWNLYDADISAQLGNDWNYIS